MKKDDDLFNLYKKYTYRTNVSDRKSFYDNHILPIFEKIDNKLIMANGIALFKHVKYFHEDYFEIYYSTVKGRKHDGLISFIFDRGRIEYGLVIDDNYSNTLGKKLSKHIKDIKNQKLFTRIAKLKDYTLRICIDGISEEEFIYENGSMDKVNNYMKEHSARGLLRLIFRI